MEVHEQSEDMGQPAQNPFKVPSMPGTPLQQVSPERLNQRIPQSPSLSNNLDTSRKTQHRLSDASDVKARIAMLNSMSHNSSPVRSISPTKSGHSSSSNAAVQRAILGREEAEATLNAMATQLDSAKVRERLVAERVESLMEQLAETRSRQRHERQVYEKEVKSAKKTEYKAELAVIKLQEELREVKSELETIKARADHDKAEKEKARQEAFERAYAIAGITEEMQTLREQFKVMEQERDSAVAMAASKMAEEEQRQADAMAAQLKSTQDQAEETSDAERKTRAPAMPVQLQRTLSVSDDMDLDAENYPVEIKVEALQRQIVQLKRERQENQELIHFMNMQCQFKSCPCRMAERNGLRFVHDFEYDDMVHASSSKKRKLEEIKPYSKPLSWLQKREMKLKKQALVSTTELVGDDIKSIDLPVEQKEPYSGEDAMQREESITEAPLPPVHLITREKDIAEQVAEVDAAAQIALPSPIDTPNNTAQLEDITQVIVEPGTSSQPFSFSASVSSVRHIDDAKDTSHQSQTGVLFSDELFDLSPPKQILPRPSTAMGILTIASPIRLVPDSPYTNLAQSEGGVDDVPSAYTTRIALNDTSPVRQARSHQRSQSRVAIRNQSRGRSPAVNLSSKSDLEMPRPASALDTTSPTSETTFPMTPVSRHMHTREKSQTQPRPQSYVDNEIHVMTESKMTIRVPLRDESELILPPAPDSSNKDDTTTIPINHSITTLKDPLANIPGTPITREAALAQIRARRDRARSLNMRNRGAAAAGEEPQVDGSTTETEHTKEMKTPGSIARRGVKIDLGARLGLLTGERERERGRDVSHASAPGRF